MIMSMSELGALAHGSHYLGQTSSATYEEIAQRVRGYNLAANARILDAGCGNGCFAKKLAIDFSCEVDGVDISRELIDEANRDTPKNCHFFQADFAEIDRKYDLILCVGSLYRAQPVEKIVQVWSRCINPGGHLLIFLNLAFGELSIEEQNSIGTTRFISALNMQSALTESRWMLTEWSDGTDAYRQYLAKWCQHMDRDAPFAPRFITYQSMAVKNLVRRIILGAIHD